MYKKQIDLGEELWLSDWSLFSSWERSTWIGPIINFLQERFQIKQKTQGNLLNIASGTKEFSEVLAKKLPDLNIFDLDITEMPKSAVYKNFIQADYQHLPVRSESIDLIINFFGLDYAKDRALAVQETNRVLKPKGLAAYILHSPASEVMRQYSLDYLFNLELALEFYESENKAMFQSFVEGNFDLPDMDLEQSHKFLQQHRNLVVYLNQLADSMFDSPKKIIDFFDQYQFAKTEVFLIDSDGEIRTIEQNLPAAYQDSHAGWFVVLKK